MSPALLAVEGLALRAQEEVGEETFFRLAGNRVQDLLKGRRRDLVEIAFQLVTKAFEDIAQVHQAVRIRPIVNPIDGGLLREEELLRHRLVRGEHELLDEAVGDVA
jgi:hypothetical protein